MLIRWILIVILCVMGSKIKKMEETLAQMEYKANTAISKARNLETELERARKELDSLRNASATRKNEEP